MKKFHGLDKEILGILVEMASGYDQVFLSKSFIISADKKRVNGQFDTQDETFFIQIDEDKEVSVWDQDEDEYEITDDMFGMINYCFNHK